MVVMTPGLKIRVNIAYIVAAVVIQDGKVLLIQEAKESCRGKWYLPAGRMEPNETIVVWVVVSYKSRNIKAKSACIYV